MKEYVIVNTVTELTVSNFLFNYDGSIDVQYIDDPLTYRNEITAQELAKDITSRLKGVTSFVARLRIPEDVTSKDVSHYIVINQYPLDENSVLASYVFTASSESVELVPKENTDKHHKFLLEDAADATALLLNTVLASTVSNTYVVEEVYPDVVRYIIMEGPNRALVSVNYDSSNTSPSNVLWTTPDIKTDSVPRMYVSKKEAEGVAVVVAAITGRPTRVVKTVNGKSVNDGLKLNEWTNQW